MGLLALRPGDLLTILKMALSIGYRSSVSFLSAIQATGLLTFAPVGLSPTEHASLSWTRGFLSLPDFFVCRLPQPIPLPIARSQAFACFWYHAAVRLLAERRFPLRVGGGVRGYHFSGARGDGPR
jgi:hypothetical protein